MRRLAAVIAAVLVAVGCSEPQDREAPPAVIFVHGLGASADEIGTPKGQFHDLLTALSARFPRTGVCQPAAQPDRPWDGSPCVFRYVEDLAEASEGGPAGAGPNDSQSGVAENAAKLAAEVDQVAAAAGGRVVLIGYSMGGEIVRAYLALHHERAERSVRAAILIDAPTQGSWGFVLDVRRHFDDPILGTVAEAVAGSLFAGRRLDLDRPAFADLRPRSDLYRRVAALPLPANVNTYTFWGDIRLELRGTLFGSPVTGATLSVGDLAILPGSPDPSALPPLGGQRFRSDARGVEAVEAPHRETVVISGAELGALLEECGELRCAAAVAGVLDVPGAHSAIPFQSGKIVVDAPLLGGRVSLDRAVLAAVGRNDG